MPPAPNPVSCPHYLPPGATQPTYVCRGCNCTIANPQHPQNAAQGISSHAYVGSPSHANVPKKTERIA